MRAWGHSLRIAVIASMPFALGMRRSISVMSGRCTRKSETASSPSVASATTVISGCALIAPEMPPLKSG